MIFNSSNIFCPIPVSLYALQFCKLASLKQRMYYEYVFIMCSMHIYSHSSYTLIYKENGSNFHSCIPAKSTNRYPCWPHIFIKLWFAGELHLTPLHAIVQMRPSFSYLDRADQKIKTDVGPAGDGGQLLFSKFLEMLIYGGSVFMDFVCTPYPQIYILNKLWTQA